MTCLRLAPLTLALCALACAADPDPQPPPSADAGDTPAADAALIDAEAVDGGAAGADATPSMPDATPSAPDAGPLATDPVRVAFPESPCAPLAEGAIAIDGAGHVFVAAMCGPEATSPQLSSGKVFVARSLDGGASFTAGASPFAGAVVLDARLAATAPGELVVFARLESGAYAFARSHDGGDTWDAARTISVRAGWGTIGVLPAADHLYLYVGTSTGTTLWRAEERGGGALIARTFEGSDCLFLGAPPDSGRVLFAVSLGSGRIAAYSSEDRGGSFTRAEVAGACLGEHTLVGDQLLGLEADDAQQRSLFSRPIDTLERERRATFDARHTTVRGFAARADGTAYHLAADDVFVGGRPGPRPQIVLLVFAPEASTATALPLFVQPWEGNWFAVRAVILPVPDRAVMAVAWRAGDEVSFQQFAVP